MRTTVPATATEERRRVVVIPRRISYFVICNWNSILIVILVVNSIARKQNDNTQTTRMTQAIEFQEVIKPRVPTFVCLDRVVRLAGLDYYKLTLLWQRPSVIIVLSTVFLTICNTKYTPPSLSLNQWL